MTGMNPRILTENSYLFTLIVLSLFSTAASISALDNPTDDTAALIEAINRRNTTEGLEWVAGVTSLSSLTEAEFQYRLGTRPPAEYDSDGSANLPRSGELDYPLPSSMCRGIPAGANVDGSGGVPFRLPESWDWRLQDGVTAITDQGNCGSCWDFAPTAAFESAILIYEGIELDLSEQQILDCASAQDDCNGGMINTTYEHHMTHGAVAESCIPYLADDSGVCVENQCQILDRLEGHYSIYPSVRDMKQALLSGPIVSIMGVDDEFRHYSGGCYSNPNYVGPNHAVLLVGWDDTVCDGRGAWIGKNSWGTDWGEDGFFYISYNTCQIGCGAGSVIYEPKSALVITHSPLDDQPSDSEGYRIVTNIRSISGRLMPASPTLLYRVDSGHFTSIQMSSEGSADTFVATIPQQIGTRVVEYYISAADLDRRTQTSPVRAPALLFSFLTGYNSFFQDDLEVENFTDGYWSHESTFAGSGDQWHLSESSNNTDGGSLAWKCGGSGDGDYDDSMDASLVLSLESLPPFAVLHFAHQIDAEDSYHHMGWGFDGGVVDISANSGASWTRLSPVNGYSYLVRRSSQPGSFPEAMPFFSGTQNWRPERFDLTGYEGEIQIRFRFVSDGFTNESGWFIDDIEITAPLLGAPPAPVRLTGFAATELEQSIQLEWRISEPVSCFGFHLERGFDSFGPFERITPQMISPYDYAWEEGSTNEKIYQFIDTEPLSDDSCIYRLISIESGGEESVLGTLSAAIRPLFGDSPVPVFLPGGPNPFSSVAEIRFILPETNIPAEADLRIFDSSGRLVAHPVNHEVLPGGLNTRSWDGSTQDGNRLETGIYYLRLTLGLQTAHRSLTLIR